MSEVVGKILIGEAVRKRMLSFTVTCFVILFCSLVSYAAVGDRWDSGEQFHCPAAGSPIVAKSNPLQGNAWEYGFRVARGRNVGKWKYIDASEFKPFESYGEFHADAAGGPGSGPDRNRWWVPHPAPKGQMYAGKIDYSESEETSGAEKYLAKKVHLVTDDAGLRGIVTLLWRAPSDGVFNISISLEHRLDAGREGSARDPFYHILINNLLMNEGRIKNFKEKADFEFS